jgi:phosphogluconate dehydratase
MLMEIMGLHMPGAAFIHPHDDLRHALTVAATQRIAALASDKKAMGIGEMLDERSFVNAIIGLHATGGSTNHTLHLPAMAAAAGIQLSWEDFADLSEIVPLLARVYPNGSADVNHFHAAGGIGFVISELLDHGLLDGSAAALAGDNLTAYASEPFLENGDLVWRPSPKTSGDSDILRPASNPHSVNGGLKMLTGNIGKAVIKTSAVADERMVISAPAAIFTNETDVKAAYEAGELNRDVVVVVRCQGPRATGMPELHSLTPLLGNLQDQGYRVALITDGRMSGASGSVPAAIHICPEAVDGGAIGKIENGDIITLDAITGTLAADADLQNRAGLDISNLPPQRGFARSLFASLRHNAVGAEAGAGVNLLEPKT